MLAALRAGEHRALGMLVETYSALLYRFAYVHTHDGALAQDAVQDVFISLWERRAEVDIRGTLKSYLYQAVRYRAINVVQRERSQERIKAAMGYRESAVARNQGDEQIEISEATVAVMAALSALPARTREIFILRQQQGMEYAEIAAALDIGIPTVHNQMSRATHAIRDALERWRSGK
jgi:RNA polymerase sigma-70 factor (ECF subfamily)